MTGFKHTKYYGNVTCCGSQAVLTAFFTQNEVPDIRLFEAFTTVPFGIMHMNDDPHRLLTCYFDPDHGIDRAFDSMGIKYETYFQKKGTDGIEALNTLISWCSESPVVLGPLNMDGLQYIFHSELLYRMDHYIVVLGWDKEKFWVCDPEGFALASIDSEALLKGWRGDTIPEGRGEFIMRRVTGKSNLACDMDIYHKTLIHLVDNMVKARDMKYGGGNALNTLAAKWGDIKADPALQRRLTFDIPVRMQRCVFAKQFLREADKLFKYSKFEKLCEEAYLCIDQQIEGYSRTVGGLLNKSLESLGEFYNIARLEYELTDIYKAMGDSLQ